MELTVLIAALQQEVEKRGAVDDAALKLAKALGMEVIHEQGLHSIEKSIRDISVDRLARRLRPIIPSPISESDSASDSEYGRETSPSQSA
jgi:hypothetical protein